MFGFFKKIIFNACAFSCEWYTREDGVIVFQNTIIMCATKTSIFWLNLFAWVHIPKMPTNDIYNAKKTIQAAHKECRHQIISGSSILIQKILLFRPDVLLNEWRRKKKWNLMSIDKVQIEHIILNNLWNFYYLLIHKCHNQLNELPKIASTLATERYANECGSFALTLLDRASVSCEQWKKRFETNTLR